MIYGKISEKTAYVACDGGERCHSCAYGCMSCSSCIEACRKDAVYYNEYGVAEIDESRCIGCGLCVKACPQEIIHIHLTDNPFIVKRPIRIRELLQKRPVRQVVSDVGSVPEIVLQMLWRLRTVWR